MVPQNEMNGRRDENTRENIAYIRQMLGELRQVALGEGADMLCYLIKMAYVEAGMFRPGAVPGHSSIASETNPQRVGVDGRPGRAQARSGKRRRRAVRYAG